MTKAEKMQAARMTRDQVEDVLRRMCEAQIRVDVMTAELNARIVAARQAFEEDLAADDDLLKELKAELQAWADANQEQFGERKSIQMVHGMLRYQTGQPTLKTVRGATWEKALARIKALCPAYVRTKEEADKEALLADRKIIGAEELRELGLMVEQAERFHVDLNLETVPREAVA